MNASTTHQQAINALLGDLERAAKALEDEIRSGTNLSIEQLRRLRQARRTVTYVEEEAGGK